MTPLTLKEQIQETIEINKTHGIYWKGVHFPIGMFKIYVDELEKLSSERQTLKDLTEVDIQKEIRK